MQYNCYILILYCSEKNNKQKGPGHIQYRWNFPNMFNPRLVEFKYMKQKIQKTVFGHKEHEPYS